jgi:peptide/nickel transport system ATP-binding protein/oligopeptide transport system ATP-binding protein
VTTVLQVSDLSTHFHTQDGVVKAVEHVSYEVAKGEVIALVGESGCGKTVSALSIVRLIQEPPGRIVSGQVIFNGTDLLKLSRQAVRKVRGSQIAMIFQEPMTSLNPVLTIRRQMTEALEIHRGMKRQEALDEAIRLLERVGITQAERRIKDYPHNFSGGMRQRVMMAMAISCQPQLIIADEPTTAVDVTIQAQLLEMLHNITKDLDTAVILITHNLGIVARYARRVYVMYAGRIVEHGSAQAVYHDPRHPYTEGLLCSVPRLDEPRCVRLVPIEGQPPDLIAPPPGCQFHPRCSQAQDQCKEGTLELVEVAPGHYTACRMARKE